MLTNPITLDLGFAKCARIWLNSYPFLPPGESEKSIFEIPESNASAFLGKEKIAIEWFRYFGGKAEYGLLGAEHSNIVGSGFRVETKCVPNFGRSRDPHFLAISPMIADARIGIPMEFAAAIEEGVKGFFTGRDVPRGCLSFDCGAFSAIESSSSVFLALTGLICEYFFSGRKLETVEQLRTLFR